MGKSNSRLMTADPLPDTAVPAFKVGTIVKISPEGRLVIDYDGNRFGPLEARCVRRESLCDAYQAGYTVLLVFENQDPFRPIVVGVLSDICFPDPQAAEFRADLDPRNATIDGNRIRLRAHEEILLECGQSSLLLRSDGKVIVKGVEIVSRASRTNKVRGACVKIN
jgi:hypothetical protein